MPEPPSTPAAALAAQRWAKVGPLVCARCGKAFEGRLARKGPRYCSASCRTQAWRERRGVVEWTMPNI